MGAGVVVYRASNKEAGVAEPAGRIVATMVLDGEMRGDMIDQLYVSPADQGRGVGGLLLAHPKQLRPARLRLYTFQSNSPARRFYEARGFIAKEFNECSRNEERAADGPYAWSP